MRKRKYIKPECLTAESEKMQILSISGSDDPAPPGPVEGTNPNPAPAYDSSWFDE